MAIPFPEITGNQMPEYEVLEVSVDKWSSQLILRQVRAGGGVPSHQEQARGPGAGSGYTAP
jgi:hypothetical protein